MTRTTITFNPCTGFGGEGRSASIAVDGEYRGMGCGETDTEAVAEALMATGMTIGEAYDAVFDFVSTATIIRA